MRKSSEMPCLIARRVLTRRGEVLRVPDMTEGGRGKVSVTDGHGALTLPWTANRARLRRHVLRNQRRLCRDPLLAPCQRCRTASEGEARIWGVGSWQWTHLAS